MTDVEKAFVEYRAFVYKTCLRFTRNHADAEDVTQDVFLLGLDRIPKLDDPRTGDRNLTTWLYRTSRFKCLRFLKRHRRTVYVDQLHDTGAVPMLIAPATANMAKARTEKQRRRTVRLIIHICKELQKVACNAGESSKTKKEHQRWIPPAELDANRRAVWRGPSKITTMANLVKISAKAPMPLMHPDVAPQFEALRNDVRTASGVDFLAKCGDVARAADFVSSKAGVANRSWHKTGRAFDYDQHSTALVIVGEPSGGKQFFRTYIVCDRRDGSQGTLKTLRDYRGHTVRKFVIDFTEMALAHGFHRIPAWNGWTTSYNKREFWHYQKTDGLTWDDAMLQLRGKARTDASRVYGVNDRGPAVRAIQVVLNALKLLPAAEIDGIFGERTKAAVMEFQRIKGLDIDGIAGPLTRAKMGL